MKQIVAMFVAFASVMAQASFEMALATINDDSPYSSRVARFDPVTRAQLGSFGQGYLTSPRAISIKQGKAYVADVSGINQSAIQVFDYNTGAHLQTLPMSGTIRNIEIANDGNLLICGNNGVSEFAGKFNIDTLALMQSVTPYTNNTIYDISQTSSGEFLLGTRNVSAWVTMHSATGSPFNFFEITTLPHTVAPMISITRSGNLNLITVGQLNEGAGVGVSRHISTTGTGVSYNTYAPSLGVIANMNIIPITETAFGHGPTAWSLARGLTAGNLTPPLLVNYNTSLANYRPAFEMPNEFRYATDLAMVVAPEPASLAALTLGFAALARKRKK